MKKKNFVTLIMSIIGGLLFALGMCMALLPEWGVMMQGIVVGVVSAAVLLAMMLIRRKMDGKPMIVLNGRVIGTTLFGILGTLVLGAGMCLVLVWNLLLWGIVAGILGIVLLLCLIPMVKGIR